MRSGLFALGIVILLGSAYFLITYYNRVTELQTFAGQLARAMHPDLQDEYVQDQQYEIFSGIGLLIGLILAISGAVQKGIPKPPSQPVQIPVPAPAQTFCRYCGAKNEADAVFCKGCGRKIA